MFLLQRKFDKAFYWFKKAGGQGNADALSGLGVYYHEGKAVPMNKREALRCYRVALDIREEPVAQFQMGKMYLEGEAGLKEDVEMGVDLVKRSYENGMEAAATLMGTLYDIGLYGYEKDDKKAFEWYSKAVAGCDCMGRYYLRRMYLKGRYVKQNLDIALGLFQLAHKDAEPVQDSIKEVNTLKLIASLNVKMSKCQ